MSSQATYDLSRLARRFRGKRSHARFVSAVENFVSIFSCRQDLETASRALDRLIVDFLKMSSPDEEDQEQDKAELGGALFFHAVCLYARATDTSSKNRTSSGITNRLNDEQKNTHREIMLIRNDALAHYGPAHIEWVRESALLNIDGDRADFVVAFSRFNYRAKLVRGLKSLVDIAKLTAEEISISRLERLKIDFQLLDSYEPELHQHLEKCKFESETIFSGSMISKSNDLLKEKSYSTSARMIQADSESLPKL
jgi:hypothetical protein